MTQLPIEYTINNKHINCKSIAPSVLGEESSLRGIFKQDILCDHLKELHDEVQVYLVTLLNIEKIYQCSPLNQHNISLKLCMNCNDPILQTNTELLQYSIKNLTLLNNLISENNYTSNDFRKLHNLISLSLRKLEVIYVAEAFDETTSKLNNFLLSFMKFITFGLYNHDSDNIITTLVDNIDKLNDSLDLIDQYIYDLS